MRLRPNNLSFVVPATEEHITLASVTTEIETGILTKSSSAVYQIAAELGTTLAGIHKLSYELSGFDKDIRVPGVSNFGGRARSKAASTGMGSLNLFHTTQDVVSVTAKFMVDPFPTEGK